MITFSKFVSDATLREGLKISISVAQMSEATKIVLQQLYEMPFGEASGFIAKHGAKRPTRRRAR